MDSVDELQRWMANYSKQLKMVKMPGALPASTQKAFDKFMVCCCCITVYFAAFCCLLTLLVLNNFFLLFA